MSVKDQRNAYGTGIFLLGLAALIFAVTLAIWVYQSRWIYDTVKSSYSSSTYPRRVDRWTGKMELNAGDGWKPL